MRREKGRRNEKQTLVLSVLCDLLIIQPAKTYLHVGMLFWIVSVLSTFFLSLFV